MTKFALKLLLVLGLCISLIFTLGNQGSALAATEYRVITNSPKVSVAVDQFLTSIPIGYYTVARVTDLKQLIKSNQTLLIDVRESSEYANGHISDAINIPLRTLVQNLDNIPQDRRIVLYCSSGYRTAMGVMSLRLLGYTNVTGFSPSINGWKLAGEPLQK